MVAPMAVAVAKTVGIKNIGKLLLGLVFLLIAALTVSVALPMTVVAAVASSTAAQPGQGGPWIAGEWAKPITTYVVSDPFGLRPNPCSVCQPYHRGVDMAGPLGAPIFAAGPGTVIHAGSLGSYGNAVKVDHGGGLVSLYGHMGYGTLRVQVGDTVTGGTQVGQEGSTGNSSGPHLHFELRLNGAAFDPMPFMAQKGLPL